VNWVENLTPQIAESAELAESGNCTTTQLLNYLRAAYIATYIEVGSLLNLGLKPEFKRLLLDNASKTNRCGVSGGIPCI